MIADLYVIMPELIIASMGLLSLIFGTIAPNATRFTGYTMILGIVAAIYSMNCGCYNVKGLAFEGSYCNSDYTLLFKNLLLGGLAIIFWGYLSIFKVASIDFIILALFSILGSMIAISSKDLLILFLGLELQSLPSYIMAGFLREKLKSSESGLKYFILGSISSAILLFGMSLIYGFTGQISYSGIEASLSQTSNIGIIVGISMVLIAMLFKMSVAPFHIWTPDVYEGSPLISVTVFSSLHKISIIAIFIGFISAILGKNAISFVSILKALAILSLIIGAFGGILQQQVKRLMAYSAILNSGYILLALIEDINVGIWRNVFLIYIIIYSVSIIAFFLIIGHIFKDKSHDLSISDMAGLSKNNKFYALSLVIILSSMIGVPPLAGFFAKYYILYNLVSLQEYALAIIAIICSVAAAFYYLRIIKAIYFDEAKNTMKKIDGSISIYLITLSALGFLICFIKYFTPYLHQINLVI